MHQNHKEHNFTSLSTQCTQASKTSIHSLFNASITKLLSCSWEEQPYPIHNIVTTLQFIKTSCGKATDMQVTTYTQKPFKNSYFNSHRIE